MSGLIITFIKMDNKLNCPNVYNKNGNSRIFTDKVNNNKSYQMPLFLFLIKNLLKSG